MRKLVSFIASVLFCVFMMINGIGTHLVWVGGGLLVFFLAMYGYFLYLDREKISVFFQKLFTFSFSKEDIVDAGTKKKSIFTPERSTSDKVATVIRYCLAIIMAVICVLGIILYISTGEVKNSFLNVVYVVAILCAVGFSLFRKRKRFSYKAKRFLRRNK